MQVWLLEFHTALRDCWDQASQTELVILQLLATYYYQSDLYAYYFNLFVRYKIQTSSIHLSCTFHILQKKKHE